MMQCQNLNVMIVVPSLEKGCVERYSIDMAIELKANGWNVVVVSAGGILLKELKRSDVDHIQMPVNSGDFFTVLSNGKALAKIIKERNINIVHANAIAGAWAGFKACKETGAKFITTFHSVYDTGLFGLKKSYNKVMAMGDAVIAPSYFIADHIVKTYKVNPEKISIIHNWFDNAIFGMGAVSVERMIKIANIFHIPEDKRVISMVGDINKLKGGLVFIDAIAKLKRGDIVAFIVGKGTDGFKRELNKKIDSLNLHQTISVADDVDIPATYALSDVVVNASIVPEAFAIEILEAGAMGRPVVATNHGGSCEIVLDDKTGKLVEPNNPSALADGISWALSLPDDERKILSSDASKNAHFNFSKSAKVGHIIDVYETVLRGEK